MSELDPVVMDQFYMKDGVTANDVTRVCLLEKTKIFWGMVETGQQNASFTYLLIQGLFCGRRDVVESIRLILWEENGFNSKMFRGI